ncbi:MAG: hypothetical protein GY882_03960 [Actinomycetia bacterium]|nr:hypothetical protein [Actinomycetes bacterium]MCP4843685.1 hypothetical protein [Actinomycetes bacterium]
MDNQQTNEHSPSDSDPQVSVVDPAMELAVAAAMGHTALKVTVYHRVDDHACKAIDVGTPLLERAYRYESEAAAALDDTDLRLAAIFRENNGVDGSELCALHCTRSLSVGDVVEIDGPDGAQGWACDPMGWRAGEVFQLPGRYSYGHRYGFRS